MNFKMGGVKRKTVSGGSSNLPDISGFPAIVAGNAIYDFGNDAEGFYKIPFFDSEENIWKQIPFKDFSQNLKSAFNFRLINESTNPETLDIKDSFIIIGNNYPHQNIILPSNYLNTPRLIHVLNNSYEVHFVVEDEARFVADFAPNKGVQTFVCFGSEQIVVKIDNDIFSYDFFYSENGNVQSEQVSHESISTDDFLRFLIFDGEERTFKYIKLSELAKGFNIDLLSNRMFKTHVLRGGTLPVLDIVKKGETRIVVEQFATNGIFTLNLDNIHLDFDGYDGTVIEVVNFSNVPLEFIWGSQQTATTAFEVQAGTYNNATTRKFMLSKDSYWRRF